MLKYSLLAATAVGLAFGTAAYAGSGNEAYTKQDGNLNTLVIQQQAGPGGNRVGTAAAPVLQQGNSNSFSETQSTGGGFSRGNNVIDAASQIGNFNSFSSNYSNNTGSNTIGSLLQQGNSNSASVGRNGSSVVGSIVQSIRQEGNSNFLSISQSGLGNTHVLGAGGANNFIGTVSQIGSNNGWSVQPPGGAGLFPSYRGTVISQTGSENRVDESSIEGSRNNNSGASAAHGIRQVGHNNGNIVAIARTLGSDGNAIHVDQTGRRNNFNLQQGVSTASTQNFITLVQTGDDNSATATQAGSGNRLNAAQSGNTNTVTANVTGNNNGSGVFSNAGASSLASSNALTSGDVFQSGIGSQTLALTVNGSGNQFAFLQTGGSLNTITATLTGGSNQAVGVQNGSSNTATLTQAGSTNVATFQQVGSSNVATISQ